MSSTANLLLVSDLHLDSGWYDLAAHIKRLTDQGERIDAVILAGDIIEAGAGSPINYALNQVPSHIPAVFVPGNHDFYGGRFEQVIDKWIRQSRGTHVHLLINGQFHLENPDGEKIVLLGTPLWSDLKSLGPLVEADLRRSVRHQIADFSCMWASDGSPWTVHQMLSQFEKAQLFLERELSSAAMADGLRRVVVTHFGPHVQSITPRWRNCDVSAYFCNHLPELVERADLWLHGHTHDGFQYQVGDDPDRGLVVCHPRGYARGSESVQAARYEPLLIKVPTVRQPWVIDT